MARRNALSAETRHRILEASRRLLAGGRHTDLGMDAIARAAQVSRVTVYKQFGSRSRLLEAVYDYLAVRGNVRRGKEALTLKGRSPVIGGFISALVDFWESEPNAIRRLHAMAALDAEIEHGLAVRAARRRHAAAHIVRRFAPAAERHLHRWTDRLVADALSVLV